MARPAEYDKVVEFIEYLGFIPGEVESIHIDPNYITVVGFEFKEHGPNAKKVKILSSGEAQRFMKQFPMHITEEK